MYMADKYITHSDMAFTIPLPPITKKNSQQIMTNRATGKPFVMPSAKYREYEATALWYIPRIVDKRTGRKTSIDYPVTVKCLFYLGTKRRCDLTNLLEAIDDILVGAGLLEDDNYNVIESHDGSRVLYDKNNPRTEVYITPIKKDG